MVLINPSVAGWEKVVDKVVSGSAVTSIDTQGLDLDNAKTYMILFRTTNTTGSENNIQIFFNNDTTATNYYSQSLRASGATIEASRSNAPYIGNVNAGTEGTFFFILAREVGKLKLIGLGSEYEQSTVNVEHRTIDWITEANVTRITLTASEASSIGIGSRLTIFKVG